MEVVHDGWLLKSPPPKRLWRAKWRDRWFVLRSGELPGQYFLEYYTDSSCRKLKGKIDLDQCEQVDAGITFPQRKFEYKFMFDIKTAKRVYYLCADTDDAMHKWVEIICQVCSLQVMVNEHSEPLTMHVSPTAQQVMVDSEFDHTQPLEGNRLDSPPPSAWSGMSGPYIPISECITGPRAKPTTRFPFNDDAHLSPVTGDSQYTGVPNVVAPRPPDSASALQALVRNARWKRKDVDDRSFSLTTSEDSSVRSPLAQDTSYLSFPDAIPVTPVFRENSPLDGNLLTSHRKKSISSVNSAMFVPPRPPKPSHLAEPSHQNYMNIDSSLLANIRSSCSSDKSRTSSNNMSLSGQKTSISSSDPEPSPLPVTTLGCIRSATTEGLDRSACEPKTPRNVDVRLSSSSASKIFSYDILPQTPDPRISPAGLYSNISAINKSGNGGPAVDRGLKPKKISDSSPIEVSLEGAVGGMPIPPSSAPPTVYRSLKPIKKSFELLDASLTPKFTLSPVPLSRFQNQNTTRAAPSPTPPNRMENYSDNDDQSSPVFKNDTPKIPFNEQVFFPINSLTRRKSNEIEYLDLDLAVNMTHASPKNGMKSAIPESSIVYKKVDFVKTEAFNKTRQSIEDDRKGQ